MNVNDLRMALAGDNEPGPRETLQDDAVGVAVAMGDGQLWILADVGLDEEHDRLRDALHDQAVVGGQYEPATLLGAAETLLLAAHDISEDRASRLVIGADPESLCRVVERCLLGRVETPRTYSHWARASLRKNGIDPLTLTAERAGHEINCLAAAGATLPRAWIAAVDAKAQRAEMIRLAESGRGW